MRTGLVLGAGGVAGASWLVGALEALTEETGWDPASADRIVGTSAGAVVGCLLAHGVPTSDMRGYITGMDEHGEPILDAGLDGARFRLHLGIPRVSPGSVRLCLSTLLRPHRHPASAVVAGWLPAGPVSTGPIAEVIDHFVDADWADHPGFWAVAMDYATGRRTVFGREDAPEARAADAVAASCAIPGFYRPVAIGGRRYVDGGVCSPSNLDLLCGQDLDMVVCLSPLTCGEAAGRGSAGEIANALLRDVARRRLERELRKLRAGGTEVMLIQPTASDLRVMGWNLMSRARRGEVIEMAARTTAQRLRRRSVHGSRAGLVGAELEQPVVLAHDRDRHVVDGHPLERALQSPGMGMAV